MRCTRRASAWSANCLLCSADDAKAVLHDLRSRKLIDVTTTPGGELGTRKPMPVAQLRWVRPRA
jgi:hypothetical protein